MDEFQPLNDSVSAVAAVSALTSGNAVREVQKSAPSGGNDGGDAGVGADARQSNGAGTHLSSRSEFARAHQKISELLSNLRTSGEASSTSSTEAAMTSMLPTPTVVIPMPPASEEMIERAIAVAEQIRADALLSRGAQAHVRSEAVEGVLAA